MRTQSEARAGIHLAYTHRTCEIHAQGELDVRRQFLRSRRAPTFPQNVREEPLWPAQANVGVSVRESEQNGVTAQQTVQVPIPLLRVARRYPSSAFLCGCASLTLTASRR